MLQKLAILNHNVVIFLALVSIFTPIRTVRNRGARLALAVLLVSLVSGRAQTLPPGCEIGGKYEQTDGVVRALVSGSDRVTASLKGPIANAGDSLFLRGKIGPQQLGIAITLKDARNESISLAIRPIGEPPNLDSSIALGWKGGWGRYYVRPNPAFYKPDEFAKRKAAWDKLPGASAHSCALELRPVGATGEYQLWLDGQFMQVLSLGAPAVSYDIKLAPEASVESLRIEAVPPTAPLVLPVGEFPRAGAIKDARLEFSAGTDVPAAFQKLGGKEAKGIAVGGLGTFTGLAADDLQSFFWRRHASHNLPEQRMFSVPLAVYSHAYVLCAADDRDGRVPEFTLRVTRYATSRGDAMGDTLVRVPGVDAKGDANARRVGTVKTDGREVPLWLLKVPLQNGAIEDLLHFDERKNNNVGTSRYLDVELLDPLPNVEKAVAFPPTLELTKRAYRPTAYNPESDVTVFGLELERSPVDMTVRANIGFQVFYRTDNPAFLAKVKALEEGNYTLQWDIADVSGQILDRGEQTVKVGAGAEQDVSVPVKQGVGWYAARFRLADSGKVERVDYRTSFVMLPPDTRKAGLESPFVGGWFQKNQGSDVKLDEVGPLLQRLGVRRVGLPDDMPESVTLPKYGFTDSTLGWSQARLAMLDFRDGKKTLPEALAAQEESIRAALKLWPSIDRMLIFHESGAKGAPFPSEIWGEPAKNNMGQHDENAPLALMDQQGGGAHVEDGKKSADEWQQNWPKRMEYLTGMAKMVREKFPTLKMQYGNDGNSLGIMGEIFRQKFPREFIDTISIEDLGQTFAPERGFTGGLQSAWFLRETARKMGYGDVPVTACTEWIGRMTNNLGLQKQAEWEARDALLALAYGFDTISSFGINDASSGYYYSIWANGGLCYRYPTMAPKPSYAAMATLTQVLDRAKFSRFVPTGSTVLYVMEFRCGDDWVYALWTPRGTREVALEFAAAAPRLNTDLYGRTRDVAGKSVSLTASPSTQYLTSKDQITSVKTGAATFPDDQSPAKPATVIPLESLAEVSIVSDKGPETASKARPGNLPNLREGAFEIREVDDEQMGKCLEIELKPSGDVRWPLEFEYVTLQLKTPVESEATRAGVWVKGNGSWGEVDIRKTTSNGPWQGANDSVLRRPGDATMNFDGWNFISYPAAEGKKNPKNRVLGLTINMPRQTIYGTEMKPVGNQKIRLKSIVLY